METVSDKGEAKAKPVSEAAVESDAKATAAGALFAVPVLLEAGAVMKSVLRWVLPRS